MTCIDRARDRLEEGRGLAAILDATYSSFEDMLSAIRDAENPRDGMFIPLVMAAAAAADGRDAIAAAPSLPPHRLDARVAEPCLEASAERLAGAIAALCALLAARLEDAAGSAADPRDRAACREAARSARDISALLGGSGP